MDTTIDRSRFRWGTPALGFVILAILSLAACQKVAFYEKHHLANALMQFDTDPSLENFMQKVIYSREATTGGIGSKVAGGCGCTN